MIAAGGLALLAGCKHHHHKSSVETHASVMNGPLPVYVQHSEVSPIIAGPLPHLLDPGVLPMPNEKQTAHNHPNGLWPAMGDPAKTPVKTPEVATLSMPKPVAELPAPGASPKNTDTATLPAGPTLTSLPVVSLPAATPVTFVATPKAPETAALPVIINAPRDTSPAAELMQRKPSERLGHGPNYRWVAGVLDKHQKGGFWTLRYADYSSDDAWGGKVRLMDDPRLAGFRNGDLLYVEGELLAPAKGVDDAGGYPPFRISHLRTLESGK